jgi:hypothetical protein
VFVGLYEWTHNFQGFKGRLYMFRQW